MPRIRPLLRDRQEGTGGEQATAGVLPADQGLGPAHQPGAQVDDRLVVQGQLVVVQGLAQLVLEAQAVGRGAVHGRVEDGV